MMNTGKLKGKTLFITGASRGIGKEIAIKAARDGANIVIAAKTVTPHPKLPGTIYTALKEVEEAGGKGLACVVDVRDERQVAKAVDEAVREFGGIDIVINNASAISLTNTEDTEMKRYDLMNNINTRGLIPTWFAPHTAYTIAKYGMSMCVLGMHQEFKPFDIAVNALWPRTTIDTVALQVHPAGEDRRRRGRKPIIMADAAYWILTQDPKPNGEFFIDEEVLLQAGLTDLDHYTVNLAYKENLQLCLFSPPTNQNNDKLGVSSKL